MKKFILIIRYRKQKDGRYIVHTGGPYTPAYWTLTDFTTLDSLKTFYKRRIKDFTLRFIETKSNIDPRLQ